MVLWTLFYFFSFAWNNYQIFLCSVNSLLFTHILNSWMIVYFFYIWKRKKNKCFEGCLLINAWTFFLYTKKRMQQQQQKFNKINWFWHLNFFLFSLVQSNEPVYHRQRHQTLDQTRYIHTQTFSHSSIWETKFKDLNKNSIFDSSFGTHINIHTSTLSLLCTKRKKNIIESIVLLYELWMWFILFCSKFMLLCFQFFPCFSRSFVIRSFYLFVDEEAKNRKKENLLLILNIGTKQISM